MDFCPPKNPFQEKNSLFLLQQKKQGSPYVFEKQVPIFVEPLKVLKTIKSVLSNFKVLYTFQKQKRQEKKTV